jgi:hypothetical protein
MIPEVIYFVDEAVFTALFWLLLILFYEVSFRLGRRLRLEDSQRSQFNTVEASVLGLLALLLAFSFSMAETRFETRKHLVMEEANALGTSYLRTGLFEEPTQSKLRELLKEYLQLRVDFYSSPITFQNNPQRVREFLELTERLQNKFWSEAVTVAKKTPTITAGLLLQSLNEVIDLHTARVVAMRNHVPETVILLLCLVAFFGMGAVGYGVGLTRSRNLFSMFALSLLIASIILVIIDMDQPRQV